jgi:hypothetical protein
MRVSVALTGALLAILVGAAAASPAQAAGHRSAHVRLAPADEYFGRQKMSILEIRNRLSDLARRAVDLRNAGDVPHEAALTEDALHDWERKYPGDPWLAKDLSALARLYARIHQQSPYRRNHLSVPSLHNNP